MSKIRIDKFLKNSRIIKRRTIAKEACMQDRVKINGKIAKPSDLVASGDVVEIEFGSGIMKFEVKELKDTAQKKDVDSMYEVIL